MSDQIPSDSKKTSFFHFPSGGTSIVGWVCIAVGIAVNMITGHKDLANFGIEAVFVGCVVVLIGSRIKY